MSKVRKAKCPHCKNTLRVPEQWLDQPMRCKHCKNIFQARPKAAPQPVASPVPAPQAEPGPIMLLSEPTVPAAYRRGRKGGGKRWIGIVAGLAVVVVAAASLIVAAPYLMELARNKTGLPGTQISSTKTNGDKKNAGTGGRAQIKKPGTGGSTKPIGQTPVKPIVKPNGTPPKKITNRNGAYPRRALVISINDYLLANPLNYGDDREGIFPGSNTNAVAFWFKHFRMKFPGTQVYELSDYAPGSPAPLRQIVKNAITQFLNDSRPQDRVMVLFSGHAVEGEDDSFLVPIEGDLEDTDTLIPISWVYKQMAACVSRQKVFVIDVCRYDPGRGNERPGGDPMGENLEKQLKNPPAGVQVWSSCSLDQQSYEFEKGSLFLEALCAAMWKRLEGIQTAADPLPMTQLQTRVNEYLAQRLKGSDLKQITFVAGQEMSGGADYNPSEPLPGRMTIPPIQLAGGKAGRAVIRSILDEINSAPPPRSNRARVYGTLRFGALPPFEAKVLEEYKMDGYTSEKELMERAQEFPLRAAIVSAKQVLKDNAKSFTMKESFDGNTSAAVKAKVARELRDPGKCLFELEEALEELAAAAKHVKDEPSKRWKAHYDYVMARLKSRLLYVLEYSTVLAKIRSEDLPTLEPGETGYRLGSRRKLSSREGKSRDWRSDVRDLWEKIIQDYPNTPWAIMARRERGTNLGLEWRPTRR